MSYKLKSDLSDEIGSIILANNKLNDAYEILNDVISLIDDGQWTGKSQKVSKALCEICHTYHKKILDNTNDEVEVLKKLYDNADGYMSSGKIPSEWR